ncbi:MAG: hypothetical protein CL908_19890 [Deltaproteobacteria bacterium]|nr:hypothetical protein [Deltaproteobacteria bacterium]
MSGFLPGIVGLEDAREQLRRMVVGDRVPTGLLLHGAAGRGKRTLALALARALLCGDATGEVDPTSACASKVDGSGHPDLESVTRDEDQRRIGIDKVRQLKDRFSLTPAEAPRRVAIVVDAERLTEEAGNALLKLLEEPPPRSHLILTGRAKDSVMETLVSRCRHLRVPALAPHEVAAFLQSRDIDPARAHRLSLIAEGRPGFALSLAGDDFETRVLAPAQRLLHSSAEPWGVAEAVAATVREGAQKAEGARENLRIVFDAVTWFLRAALRHAVGSQTGQESLELLDPATREALAGHAPQVLEGRLESVLAARSDLDRNIALEAILGPLATSFG